VVLGDPYRNEQGGCDHLVGLTVGNKVENLLLAISQASQMFPRLRCVRRREFTEYQALAWAGEQVVPRR
jgi:hypothetical protein